MANRLKIAFALLLSLLLAGVLIAAAGCGGTKTVTESQIDDYNKPGIVYLVTTWTADVDIPTLDINTDGLVAWATAEVLSGRVASDEDSILNAVINELLAHPQLYYIPSGQTTTQSMESSISGNGFIINPEGNIITAAHMVKASEDDIKFDMAKEAAANAILDELDSLESGLGFTLTDSEAEDFMLTGFSIYADYLTVGDTKQKTQVYTGNIIDKARDEENGLTAETIKVGDPIDLDQETGKDVAILKINGGNLPTVQLGDDSGVRDGDKVFGLGYLSQKSSESDSGTIAPNEDKPTLVTGSVAGHRKMEGGWEVLQMQIPLEEGSSGSPILDSDGNAVGVMTFVTTTTDEETGAESSIDTEKFAVPISVVKDYMSQVNVSASEGNATKTYREGVDLFAEDHYSAAKDKFTDVKNTNPDFPFIQDFITECQSNIDKGLDKGTFPWMTVIIILVIAAVVVAVIVVVLLVVLPKSKKKAGPGETPGAGPTPPPAPPAA